MSRESGYKGGATPGNLKFDGNTKPFASNRERTYQNNNMSEKTTKMRNMQMVLCINHECDKQNNFQ